MSALISVGFIFVQSLTLIFAQAKFCRISLRPQSRLVGRFLAITARTCFTYAILIAATRAMPTGAEFLAIPAIALLSLYESANFLTLRYLGLETTSVILHSRRNLTWREAWISAISYARTFVPVSLPVCVVILSTTTFLAVEFFSSGVLAELFAVVGVGLISLAGVFGIRARPVTIKPTSVEANFLTLSEDLPTERLYTTDRRSSVVQSAVASPVAKNVLVLISESAGADINSSFDQSTLLVDRLCDLSDRPAEWFKAREATTASSCTDISVPCILTGCGAHESVGKLHKLPMIFDLAKKRGMRTLFYTSGAIIWSSFNRFFDSPALDDLYSPETDALPLVNELNADDYLFASKLCDFIQESSEDFCAVLFLNALHVPFQSESACIIPSHLIDRRRRAAYISEINHKMIFDALKKSGRYDDSLIILVGDHGETIGNNGADGGVNPRLTQLSRTVLQPMFAIKPPTQTPAAWKNALLENMNGLVSTLDIAPTIARFLGVELREGLSYAGSDLCVPVDQTRLLYTLNVNEWRSWPQAAAAISRGSLKVAIDYQSLNSLCTDLDGCAFRGSLEREKDELLAHAANEPVLQRTITRIFRNKMGRKLPHNETPALQASQVELKAARFYQLEFFPKKPQIGRMYGRLHANGGEILDKGFVFSSCQHGLILYGPYIALDKGAYEAIFRFDDIVFRRLRLDVNTSDGGVLTQKSLSHLSNDGEVSISFALDEIMKDVEIRLYNEGSSGAVRNLTIRSSFNG